MEKTYQWACEAGRTNPMSFDVGVSAGLCSGWVVGKITIENTGLGPGGPYGELHVYDANGVEQVKGAAWHWTVGR